MSIWLGLNIPNKHLHVNVESLNSRNVTGTVGLLTLSQELSNTIKAWTYIWTVRMSGDDPTVLWKLPDSVNLDTE